MRVSNNPMLGSETKWHVSVALVALSLLLFSLIFFIWNRNLDVLVTGGKLSIISLTINVIILPIIGVVTNMLLSWFQNSKKIQVTFILCQVSLFVLILLCLPLVLVFFFSNDFVQFVLWIGGYSGVTFTKKIELLFYFMCVTAVFLWSFFSKPQGEWCDYEMVLIFGSIIELCLITLAFALFMGLEYIELLSIAFIHLLLIIVFNGKKFLTRVQDHLS